MKSPGNSPHSGSDSIASAGAAGTKADLFIALYELLEGKRAALKIYSHRIGGEILLVNPELYQPEKMHHHCPVYTTQELAFILNLNSEEFRRFHYLKTRLVD